jgi:hypothetical protein
MNAKKLVFEAAAAAVIASVPLEVNFTHVSDPFVPVESPPV